MIFSLLLLDRAAGQIGVAVASHLPFTDSAVVCAKAETGVVVAHPAVTAGIGRQVLEEMETGLAPNRALSSVLTQDSNAALYQVHAMNFDGQIAAMSGTGVGEYSACTNGAAHSLAGMMMPEDEVFFDLERSVFKSEGQAMIDRLVAFLNAGVECCDSGSGLRSAGLILFDREMASCLDLRITDAEDPVLALSRLVESESAYV